MSSSIKLEILDECDFFLAQAVLGIQLTVNVRNALAPVNVAVCGEILKRNENKTIFCYAY